MYPIYVRWDTDLGFNCIDVHRLLMDRLGSVLKMSDVERECHRLFVEFEARLAALEQQIEPKERA